MSENEKIAQRLNQMLAQFVELEPTAGLAVGIIKDRETFYARGFGVKRIDTEEYVDELTLFHMASVSKTFVATGIMRLVEQGKLDLDSLVTDYVPYFRLADNGQQAITVRQLLSHTSGMPDEDDFQWDNPEFDDESLERYIRSIAARSLERNSGEAFAYSNIGYELLGDVIAKASGVSFETYMKEHVLLPANMKNSTFLLSEAPVEQLASPHVLGANGGYGAKLSNVFPYHRAHGPSSTLYTNAVDMCEYMKSHLTPGKLSDETQILRPESYHEMWKVNALTGYGPWMEDGIGLGWFLGNYNGHRVVSHTGRDTGFRSYFILLPDSGIGVTLMINVDFIGIKVLVQAILDLLLDENVPVVKRSLAHYLSGIALSSGIADALLEFERIQRDEPAHFLIDDEDFNSIGYELQEHGCVPEAIQLLELAVRLFPNSSRLHESLGEMYERTGR